MRSKQRAAALSAALTLLLAVTAAAKSGNKTGKSDEGASAKAKPVLWVQPDDIKARNLFYGPGGEAHAPHTTYTFDEEDMNGTSPKFIVHDENGVKWKVKLAQEVHPETAATRLVWAVGYSTNEDYYLPSMQVENMPPRLRRGQNFVGPAGTVHEVRLKRYLEGEKKIGNWRWRDNPFVGTKELSGLKVMMALINNWDLKDSNNSVYHEKHPDGSDGPEDIYMVSDLGASFGTTGFSWTQKISKGNLNSYRHSKFIRKATSDHVDFNVPTRASLIHIFDPPEYWRRLTLLWIGKGIPRADVEWIAGLLEQLSPDQIRDAFRAAGYQPDEVEGFSKVVENRIAQLRDL